MINVFPASIHMEPLKPIHYWEKETKLETAETFVFGKIH